MIHTHRPGAHRGRRSASVRALAAASLLALIAAACAGDDDDGAGEPEDATSETPAGDTGDSGDTGTGDTGTNDTGDGEEAGEPVHGGHLVYGVEADTDNPWPPFAASYATSGYIPLSAITDSLFVADADAQPAPHLAESAEPNDDYTEWTIEIREGIEFHDGTPLDAEAVKFNIETCVGSPLTGTAYSEVGDITAEGQTVTIQTRTGPWVKLPVYFQQGACGHMLSKEWLQSLPDVPHRNEESPYYDEELAATPADGDPAAPVGVGAFVFESYQPGNGNSFTAVRNENYWRGPNGITGEELPYLDSIEAVVAVDIDSRANALRSGQFDVIHTANADSIAEFQDDDNFETEASDLFGDTGYLMMNVAEGTNYLTEAELDPEDANADNPLLTLACRKALAHATDRDRIAEERGAGIIQPANGPFPPGSVGHLDDSGYPEYDPAAAQEEMDACLAEQGTDQIQFSFNTTNDPFNVETNQLIISMWQEVFGDQVQADIQPIEQGQYIGLALFGDFDMFGWRNHGGTDPDQQILWWTSLGSTPIGAQALNFGRFNDEVIDENLAIIRTDPDPDARAAAAEEVNRRFGEQVYNLWTTWTLWGVISTDYVNDKFQMSLPDGGESLGLAMSGRHPVAQIWCEGGSCE